MPCGWRNEVARYVTMTEDSTRQLSDSQRRENGIMSKLDWHKKEISSLGPLNWLSMRRTRHKARTQKRGLAIPVGGPVRDLYCRAQTSDLDVFYQIFVTREYRCLDHVRDPKLIIDCGANVGYSSAYFLARYPNAKLIAVEPEFGNFTMLRRNLRQYEDRTKLINSGVWSKTTGLRISEEKFGDGREWAVTVREACEGECASMQAVDLSSLLQESGFDRISILKIDIEGSEVEVLKENTEWLKKVDHLVIELHGPDCERALFNAIDGLGAKISQCEELTVCEFAA
jgi:FkbM family methyltransferase